MALGLGGWLNEELARGIQRGIQRLGLVLRVTAMCMVMRVVSRVRASLQLLCGLPEGPLQLRRLALAEAHLDQWAMSKSEVWTFGQHLLDRVARNTNPNPKLSPILTLALALYIIHLLDGVAGNPKPAHGC